MSFGQTAQPAGYLNPNNDYTIGETINDGIQDLAWSPTSNVLVSGSWDNFVRCWEVQQQGTQFNAMAKAQIAPRGPCSVRRLVGYGCKSLSNLCIFVDD